MQERTKAHLKENIYFKEFVDELIDNLYDESQFDGAEKLSDEQAGQLLKEVVRSRKRVLSVVSQVTKYKDITDIDIELVRKAQLKHGL